MMKGNQEEKLLPKAEMNNLTSHGYLGQGVGTWSRRHSWRGGHQGRVSICLIGRLDFSLFLGISELYYKTDFIPKI